MRKQKLNRAGKDSIQDTPWAGYPSIFEHIKNNIDADGKLTDAGDKLPDESRRFKEGELRWVSGAMDGVFGHHGDGDQKMIIKIADLINKISLESRLRDKTELYSILAEDNLMEYIDPTLRRIIDLNVLPDPYLHDLAKWLAFESPDRGPVKFGVALLGLIRDANDLDNLLVLGRHEEFTLYVAVAVSNTVEDAEKYLWELAKYVSGWGRIHLVERLEGTDNPEIKRWMVTEGYKNRIMYEYLAYICAKTGELKKELSQQRPDEALLNSAGEIIEALINGGPAKGINSYEDAGEVVTLYLHHTLGKHRTLNHFLILNSIKAYLSDQRIKWVELSKNGWNDDVRTDLLIDINKELSNPTWALLVREKQHTYDSMELWKVDRAARILGIDMWKIYWQRLRNNPTEPVLWYNVMENANSERIDPILDLALDTIPLNKISTGAEDSLGIGEEYNLHECLEFIVQSLSKFPGKGKKLILAALKSPVTRDRNMAIKVLDSWSKEYISAEIRSSLIAAEKVEPDTDTKRNLKRLVDRHQSIRRRKEK